MVVRPRRSMENRSQKMQEEKRKTGTSRKCSWSCAVHARPRLLATTRVNHCTGRGPLVDSTADCMQARRTLAPRPAGDESQLHCCRS